MAFEPVIRGGFPLIIEREGEFVPAVDDDPECEDCCPEPGIWDWYHEYADAGYSPPSVIATENFARTASVYYEASITDIDSYPDWFIAYSDPKEIFESIAPLGVIAQEIVYYRIDVSGDKIWIAVDAQAKSVLWERPDADWSPDPEIGPGVRVAFTGSVSTIDYDVSIPKHNQAAGGLGVGASGVIRWQYNEGASEFEIWELPAQQYTNIDDPIGWGDVGGAYDDPVYTYSNLDFTNFWDIEGSGELRELNDYFMPIGQPPQTKLAVGARRSFIAGLPETYAEFQATNDYTANIEFNLGPLEVDVLTDQPYVDGGMIWSFARQNYHHAEEDPDISSGSIEAQIDNIDARDAATGGHIAIITYKFTTAFGGDLETGYFSTDVDVHTVLVIDGSEIYDRVMVRVSGIDEFSPTYDVDRRAYYPQWAAPSCLHPTEQAQGGGTRAVVFERVPQNPSEAQEYNDQSALAEWRLRCFRNTILEYSITSRWGRFFQGSGSGSVSGVSLNFSFGISVIPGSCADREIVNSGIFVNIVDREEEDAVVSLPTVGLRELTVYMDISGGHDLSSDFRDIVNAAGDFQITSLSDEFTLLEAGTNLGSIGFSNASDFAGSPGSPYIADSSNRYYYVHNFPMRVRELVNNRWTCYFDEGTFNYPITWMISHNGEVKIPCGVGENNWDRNNDGFPASNPISSNVALSYSCVKNCNLIPLCPPLFDENFHDDCDDIPPGEPPTVRIVQFPVSGTSPDVFFRWVTTGVVDTTRISLDGSALEPFEGDQIHYFGLLPGPHAFFVRVDNEFGWDSDQRVWTQGGDEPDPPTVEITSAPSDPTFSTSATFAWEITGIATVIKCNLDGVESNCTSPVTYENLEPGEHEFTVTVSNPGGEGSDSHEWEIEELPAGAPTVTITEKPPAQTSSDDVTFAWVTTGDVDTTTCELDPGSSGSCSSPTNYTSLTPGIYTFRVTVENENGESFDEWTFEVLAAPPDPPTVTITQAPPSVSSDPNALFDWTTTGFIEDVTCELDGEEVEPCSKPKSFTALADGPHTFRVTVENESGSDFDEHDWTISATHCSLLRELLNVSGTTAHVTIEVELVNVTKVNCTGGFGIEGSYLLTGPTALIQGNSSCTGPLVFGDVLNQSTGLCNPPGVNFENVTVNFSTCDLCFVGEGEGGPLFNVPDIEVVVRYDASNPTTIATSFADFRALGDDAVAIWNELLLTGEAELPLVDQEQSGESSFPRFLFDNTTCIIRVTHL